MFAEEVDHGGGEDGKGGGDGGEGDFTDGPYIDLGVVPYSSQRAL